MTAGKNITDFVAFILEHHYSGVQAELARAVEVEPPSVFRWLRGGDIRPENLASLSRVTGYSIDSIVNGSWREAVPRPMPTIEAVRSPSSSFPGPMIPVELQSAAQWQIEQGEDPKEVSLAAARALRKATPGRKYTALDWAAELEVLLERISKLKKGS